MSLISTTRMFLSNLDHKTIYKTFLLVQLIDKITVKVKH